MSGRGPKMPEALVDAVTLSIEVVSNPVVEGHERGWALTALNGVPDGWAKVDGEWLRITSDGVGYGEFVREA